MPNCAVGNSKNTSKLVGLSRGNVSYHRYQMSPADVLLVTVALTQAIAFARTSHRTEAVILLKQTAPDCIVAQDDEGVSLWQSCNDRAVRVILLGKREVSLPRHKCERQANFRRFRCINNSSVAFTHVGEPILLKSESLVACGQRNPLTCLLELVPASYVSKVDIKSVHMPLQSELQGLNNVTHLRLFNMGKDVRLLPYKALEALPSLLRLVLIGGSLQLKACEECWKPLKKLEMLELQRGELRVLPELAFFNLSHLRNLSLFSNKIDTIEDNAFEGLSSLEYLSLNNNELKALPPDMLRPTLSLRHLSLYNNGISELPQLGHLKHLEDIWVNNRNKDTLSLYNDTFAGLGALRSLRLECCRIQLVPERLLNGCNALVQFSLQYNNVTELPTGLFINQSSLRFLDLTGNKIKHMQGGVFYALSALEKLNLSDNKLTQLDSQLFEGLSKVTHLSLAHNLLQQFLTDNVRYYMPNLESVDYSYNLLSALGDEDLLLLTKGKIDMRHNKISRVMQQLGNNNSTSELRFQLGDNPFHCDCEMYHFLQAIKPKIPVQFDLEGARCSGPLSQSGKLLVEVQPDQLVCSLPPADCPGNCTCEQRPSSSTLELDCQSVTQTMPNPLKYGARGVRLRLRSPLANVKLLSNDVRYIDLSGLQLKAPPTATDISNCNWTVDLSNNNLTSAPLNLLQANCKVLLAGNPLVCDCSHRESLVMLRGQQGLVKDHWAVRCKGGQLLSAVDVDGLCATRDALLVGLGAAVLTVLLLLIVHRFHYEMRLLLGRFAPFHFLLPDKDDGMLRKKYDVFVSFSHHDNAFVQEVLVPALEGGRRPLRLCLHYRDWEVGDLIPEQIDRSVRESWRTLVVLSEHFVKSVWGRHEFRVAHGIERVIVLVLGDAMRAMDADEELRAYKKTHTCIMASHPLVWDHIKDAVCRSKCTELVAPEKDEKETEGGGLNVVIINGKLVNVGQALLQ